MAERPSRKLAVILHADIVGSTQLVQQNETLAHERIQNVFHRLSDVSKAFGGTTHELRGDALLAEFTRASDAVSAALAFQAENSDFNASLSDDLRPDVRIGIAMGEVVIADHTVTGPGVVLAQRLEQLAPTGQVCIQDAAFQTLPKRLPFKYDGLHERELKGFDEPVRAHVVTLLPGAILPTPDPPTAIAGHVFSRPRLLGVAVVSLIAFGLWLMLWRPWESEMTPASARQAAFPLPDIPSIAVLPFTNMSDESNQEYFVDGMTDDLITDLSKLSGIFVIARNTTFTYKGQSVNVQRVAQDLGVRYVLEGSVRRAGERVRINAQLIDAKTGGHLWAERYDGSISNVFALQDKVTQKIVNALALHLTADEKERAKRGETSIPDAYDAFLQGWARYRHFTAEDFRKAISHFKRALALDPDYGRAHAALAAVYIESQWHSWRVVDNFYRDTNQFARRHLQEAMKNPTALAYRVASFINILESHYEEAMENARHAIALDPNDPNGYEAVARILIYAGNAAESLSYIDRAERLDPRSSYLYLRGIAQFHLERYGDSAESLFKYVQNYDDSNLPFLYLASAYGYLDRQSDAKSAFDSFRKISIDHGFYIGSNALDQVSVYYFNVGGAEEKRLREGLRKAGFDQPPEILESSLDGIRLKKTVYGTVARVYETAKEHCQSHGKKSFLISASGFPVYAFQCR